MKKIVLLALLLLVIPSAFAVNVELNDYDPKPAEAGEFLTVWLRVENPTNQDVGEAEIEITPKDGLSLTAGESARKRVGFLNSRGYQVVEYRLKVDDNAVGGDNIITAQLIRGEAVAEFDIAITVEEREDDEVLLEVADIISDPTRIKPGDEDVKIDLVLQNLGESVAKGVKASIRGLPDGVTGSDSYSTSTLIGSVNDDGQETGTFYLDIDEDVLSGDYTAQLQLSYKYKPDEDDEEFILDKVTVPWRLSIKGVPLYEITEVSFNTDVLSQGQQNVKMVVTVKNVGEEEGETVRLKVYGKTEQPFEYEVSSNFIAPSLEPGESGQATIEFDVDDTAALQTYLLDVEIKNIVDDDTITYDKTVEVTISEEVTVIPWKFIIAGGLILTIVSVSLYTNRKKKKKSKGARKVRHNYSKSELDR